MSDQPLQISASKIRCYAECPAKWKYKYVDRLPELEHDYFEIGKNVEDTLNLFLKGLSPKEWLTIHDNTKGTRKINNDELKMAEALYSFKPFRELVDGKKLTFQKEYDTPLYRAFTDIETDECVIDVKTSAADWNEQTVQESKWQPKIYTKLTGKPFYFLVVNKKTKRCQLIKVPVGNYDDLHLKTDELKLAIELGVFQPKPSFKCRFCDFKAVCDKDRWFTK